MNMDIVKIYEDSTQEVYMFKSVADWLWRSKATKYKLFPYESEVVLNEIVMQAFRGEKIKGRITTTMIVPVLSKELEHLTLSDSYHIFEEAILLINDAIGTVDYPLTDEWRAKVSLLVEYYYQLQGLGNCKCGFFSSPLCGIDGYLCYYNEDSLTDGPIILPFVINDGKFKKLY